MPEPKHILESILFAAAEPVDETQLATDLGGEPRVTELLAELQRDYEGRGIRLERQGRHWAFRNREVVGVAKGRVAYFVVNTASMALPLAFLAFSRYVLDRSDPVSDNIAANVVGLAAGTAARFWAFRKFVFLHPATAARRRELQQARPTARTTVREPGPGEAR